ncbi:enoyl-CoA hydratase-related protein [Fundidesulfovibrio agrisoli]|uniref:enoyl-CoA hydratase-related protein n=1 Tax=Fundidesulfovibrio agrisoli TaxID=2922717 RepID=UPI001FAD5EE4|nr:enoyl-CoA hydratase-related protein [Fundidesulfovibrio agrisoli]
MKTHARLTTDNELFTSTLENGVLVVRKKRHMLHVAKDIATVFSFYEYLESMLASRAFKALVVFGHPDESGQLAHGKFLCKALSASREKAMDMLINVVNKFMLTLSSLNCITVYAGRGTMSLFNLNLGLAYDYRLVADDTLIENPNAALGMVTKGSGYFMPRLLGVRKATEVLQWKSFSAEEALQLGLIDRIVPAARLERETMEFVAQNLAGSPSNLLAIRKLLKCDLQELERSLQLEDHLIKERLESPEFRQAFAEHCRKAFGCDMEALLAQE